MSLTPEQKVTASEATRETLERVEAKAAGLTAEQETRVGELLTQYVELRDKVKFELRGKTNYTNRVLLEKVEQRIRKHFGWNSVSPEAGGVVEAAGYVGGVSESGKRSVESDSDRARPAFTRGLFEA